MKGPNMIDLVHNDLTGFTVVHDEPALDEAFSLRVETDGACTFLGRGGGLRRTGRVPEDMLDAFRVVGACRVIRMDGRRVASERDIGVRSVA
jgi:hypothetical protein